MADLRYRGEGVVVKRALAKILMDKEEVPSRKKLMKKRMSIYYPEVELRGEVSRTFTDQWRSLGDRLSLYDVEVQYEAMKLALRLVVFDDVISEDHMKFLRECMKSLHPYLVKHLELYYAPLEQGWASERVFAIPSLARLPYLTCLQIPDSTLSDEVHRQFSLLMRQTATTILLSKDRKKVWSAQRARKEYVDAYCELFGLHHYICPALDESSLKKSDTMGPYTVAAAILGIEFFVVAGLTEAYYLLPFPFLLIIGLYFSLGWENKKAEQIHNLAQERFEKDRENVLPLIIYVCQLNPSARKHQVRMLRSYYTERIDIYLEEKVSYSEAYEKISKCSGLEYEKRRDLVDLLFKLAVEDDGIKNDEWYFLQSVLSGFRFSPTFIAHYQKRYGSLRTEQDPRTERSSSKSSASFKAACYATLGVQEGASDEEVKRAYHVLALQHHPDLPKNADRKVECEALMAKINEAYERICG